MLCERELDSSCCLFFLLPFISSFFFLSSFQISKKFISLLSGSERPTKLKFGPHMDSRLLYYVYLNQVAIANLFLYFFIFLSLKFQNIQFLSHFSVRSTKLKLDTQGQWVDLLCTPHTSSQYICIPSFFCLIKKLHLNIPLMAMAGVM